MNPPGLPLRIFGAPFRYIQGPGAMASVGEQAALCGGRALLVADRLVLDLVGDRIRQSCQAAGVVLTVLEFGGEVSLAEIDRLGALAEPGQVSVVIAAGGGKGIDIGKAISHRLGVPVMTVPTAASNDAPTSKIFVVYDESHRLQSVEHMVRNPVAVVVDTAVIAQAPRHLYLAGIGDALSKKYEVERCAAAGGLNFYGGIGTLAAQALAGLCDEVLRKYAEAALEAVDRKVSNAALEHCTEATVLLSGMCFENGGLSIAHAMTRGLSAVRGARDALHGLAVAYGLLVQLALEQRDFACLEDLRALYGRIGLPVSLADLGVTGVRDEDITEIARLTMTAPHVRNFPRVLDAAQIAQAIRTVERRAVRS